MDNSVELAPWVYSALAEAARKAGTTPAGWIAAHLPRPEVPPPAGDGKPRTMADLFAGHVGLVHGNGSSPHTNEEVHEAITDYLLEKKRDGTL